MTDHHFPIEFVGRRRLWINPIRLVNQPLGFQGLAVISDPKFE
jgi:hypothetical protein